VTTSGSSTEPCAATSRTRLGEARDGGHAALEQVAGARGSGLEQRGRVPGLDLPRDEEHADTGKLGADRAHDPGALVAAMGLGELGDRHVRAMRADLAQQVAGVACLAGDLEVGVLQQADHRCPAQSRVRGDHDPDAGHEVLGRSGRGTGSARTAASALAGSKGLLRVAP